MKTTRITISRLKSVRRSLFAVAAMVLCILALPPRISAADYVIGEGDLLMISVWSEKELSLPVKVRPDGKITLPALGEVAAARLTPYELQMDLTKKLRGIVKNPVVTVIVQEVTNNKVYVFGGGISSGVYSLTQRTTLLQLLCQIGQQKPVIEVRTAAPGASGNQSTAQTADLRNASVIRNGKTIKKGFYDLFVNGNLSQDIDIEPNDLIFIPAFQDRNVYVMGAVTTPKAIAYRDGLTVVEAILVAGVFTKYAKQNDTVVYRKDGAQDKVIPVKVKNLINDGDLSQNARVQPGDYVVVYESIF
jgi:polysaccharide export outer membrane protein